MRSTAILTLTLLALGGLTGCSKKATRAKVQPVAAPAPVTVAAKDDAQHGTRKLKGLDVPVFVDGVQVSVLRYGDLPPIERVMLDETVPAFRVYDYLKAVGVKPESVRAVHIHGNTNQIAGLEGREMMSDTKRFIFSFASGDTGAPMVRWDNDGLKSQYSVHEIRKLSVFVKKPVPPLHKDRLCHLAQDGTCTDAVPYNDGTVVKGTRLYVDGKMVGHVKRRLVADRFHAGTTATGEQKYSLGALLADHGVTGDVRSVELIAGDEVIGRADASAWKTVSGSLTFTLPKHGHGKVRVQVPSNIQAPGEGATEREALTSAVHVYVHTKPAARDLVPISEDTDLSVQLASNDERKDTQ